MWHHLRPVRRGLVLVAAFIAAASAASTPASAATVDCKSQNLQTKIDNAPAGATLKVKGSCVGTFTIAKSLTLVGSLSATLDAQQEGTTLTITGTPTVHLRRLRIVGGLSPLDGFGNGRGGGISHAGGKLTLDAVTVTDNVAVGIHAEGGGIFSDGGPLTIGNSHIVGNTLRASSGSPGSVLAFGAGVSSDGRLTIVDSSVSSNEASAISSAPVDIATWASVDGAAIYAASAAPLEITRSHINGNRGSASALSRAIGQGAGVEDSVDGAKVTLNRSTVSGNVMVATSTGSTADIFGGAVDVSIDTAKLRVVHSGISHNRVWVRASGGGATATGGLLYVAAGSTSLEHAQLVDNRINANNPGSATITGGLLYLSSGALSVSGSRVAQNIVSANGGSSNSTALGGVIAAVSGEPIVVETSTIDANRLKVSANGANAVASGGVMYPFAPVTIRRSTLSRNVESAVSPGFSATATGGVLTLPYPFNSSVVNSTITGNVARADTGGAGATSLGGAISTNMGGSNSLVITNSTIARNRADGSGITHGAGGIQVASGNVQLRGSILALNSLPSGGSGPNCTGALTSGGFNLLGSVAGCGFTSVGSDKVGKNPKLGPLGNHGGPTPTLPLLAGSLAIDAIPKASCFVGVDQRGVKRPQNGRCDIGSFERK